MLAGAGRQRVSARRERGSLRGCSCTLALLCWTAAAPVAPAEPAARAEQVARAEEAAPAEPAATSLRTASRASRSPPVLPRLQALAGGVPRGDRQAAGDHRWHPPPRDAGRVDAAQPRARRRHRPQLRQQVGGRARSRRPGPRRARPRLDREATLTAITAVIAAQVAAGDYVSKHLREGAVDVRCSDMSRAERAKLQAARPRFGYRGGRREPHLDAALSPQFCVGRAACGRRLAVRSAWLRCRQSRRSHRTRRSRWRCCSGRSRILPSRRRCPGRGSR
jgi:hypothetical protein